MTFRFKVLLILQVFWTAASINAQSTCSQHTNAAYSVVSLSGVMFRPDGI